MPYKQRKILLLIVNIIASIFLVFLFINIDKYDWITLNTISGCGIFLLVLQIVQFAILKTKFSDFRVWFILLSYLFLFGRLFILFFIPDYHFFWIQFSRYSIHLLNKAALFALVSIQVFYTSFLFSNQEKTQDFEQKQKENDKNQLFIVGFILLIFSLPFRLYEDILNIIAAQQAGSFLAVQVWSGIANILSIFFVPGIIFLMVSSKKHEKSLMIITITYLITVMLFTGDRRYQTTGILSIILAYFVLKNVKMKPKIVAQLAIVTILGLHFLASLRYVRDNVLDNFDIVFGTLFNFNSIGTIFLETLSEFGLSFFSLVAVIKHIPNTFDYLRGVSFLGAIPSAIPGTGMFLGDFFKYVSISNTINHLSDGYPVGATIYGDFYANFGSLSFIFIFIFGLILSKIFVLRPQNDKNRLFSIALYYSMFYVLINLVRASFFEVFRSSIYIYLVIVLLYYVLRRR